jgi:hypothetical protein
LRTGSCCIFSTTASYRSSSDRLQQFVPTRKRPPASHNSIKTFPFAFDTTQQFCRKRDSKYVQLHTHAHHPLSTLDRPKTSGMSRDPRHTRSVAKQTNRAVVESDADALMCVVRTRHGEMKMEISNVKCRATR